MIHDLFAALAAWVTGVVKTGGYPGIAGLTILENLFPPIPSELILPVAGFLTAQGQLEFVWAVVAATIGSLAGALILYGLGFWLGERRLRRFVARYGAWLALEESDVDQARDWFRRHGGKAVLIGRLIPSVRSVISIPAGLAHMPLLPFVAYTTLGSAFWNTALVASGWLLGDQWDRIKPYLQVIEWAALVALAGGLAWFVRQRRARRGAEAV